MPAGRHQVRWDGRHASGESAGVGIYLARLRSGGEERLVKLVRSE